MFVILSSKLIDTASKLGPSLQVGEGLVWKDKTSQPAAGTSTAPEAPPPYAPPPYADSSAEALSNAPSPPTYDPAAAEGNSNWRGDRVALPSQ